MKTTVVGRKCTPKDSFKAHADKKLQKIDKFFSDEAEAKITVTVEKSEQLVELNNAVSCNITASGGVTDINDIITLRNNNLYGAICGKSIYQGTLSLREAVEVCK